MAINAEQRAQILRYFHVEQWTVGTIARQLGVHHSTVDRVLSQVGLPKPERAARPSILDPYLPFIIETLERFPTLTASRLYAMVQQRGYRGGPDHFRHQIGHYRPRPMPEAYHRLRTLPGEQAQVDWGHFGHVQIGQAQRPLMAFVIVLSWSRQLFVRFYLNAQLANFLHAHQAAFCAWNGLARVLLYDNLKSVVLERHGQAIRFHPTLLEFAAHYRFEPRPVAVARGNEKGRVERAIRVIREQFFAARQWRDLDDLNAQAQHWCQSHARRPCPERRSHSVAQMFVEETPALLSLPANPFPVDDRREVRVGKTPYIRYDLNDYSVPHTHVQRTLTVSASQTRVRVLDAGTVVAEHPRCFDQAQQIENPEHIAALTERKRHARQHRHTDYLACAVANSGAFLAAAAARGHALRPLSNELLELLEHYGAAELHAAIAEALTRGVPHTNAVRLCLERRRDEQHRPPPLPIALPNDPRVRQIVVRPATLADYDLGTATGTKTEENDDER